VIVAPDTGAPLGSVSVAWIVALLCELFCAGLLAMASEEKASKDSRVKKRNRTDEKYGEFVKYGDFEGYDDFKKYRDFEKYDGVRRCIVFLLSRLAREVKVVPVHSNDVEA
jgi:hypothetical protein